MTISRSDNKVTFTCNGSTHVFTFEFPIIDSGDLVVTLINTATGEETVLTSGTNYAVAASDSGYGGGGTVTTQAAGETGMEHYSYPAGYTILIQRSTPKTQLMDLRTGQVVDLQDIEDAFDKMQAQILDMQETIDRCIKFPARDTSPEAELAAAPLRANKFLAFDTDGDAQASSGPIEGINPTTYAENFLSLNNATEARAALEIVETTPPPDVYPEDYGVVGDGATDDSANMQAFFNTVAAMTYRPRIVFKSAKYHIHTGLSIPYAQGMWLSGTGGFYTPQAAGYTDKVTTLDYTGNGTALLIGDGSQNATGLILEKLYFKGTASAGAGVKFNTSAGWVMRDCTIGQFTKSGAVGLWILKAQVSSLYNCSFISNHYGSYMEGDASENTTLSFYDCVWHSNTNIGHVEDCGVLTRLINPTFQSNAGSAIVLDSTGGPWVANNFNLIRGYFSQNNESITGVSIDIKGDATSPSNYHFGPRIADCYFGSPGAAQTAFIKLQYTNGAIIENPRFGSVTDDILIADQTANPNLELLYWRAGETRIKDAVGGSQVLVTKDIDVNIGPIDFLGTAAASVAGAISTWTTGATINGFVKVRINGADRWLPYYTAPSS